MVAGETAGLAEEDVKDTKSQGVIYILNRYNNKPSCSIDRQSRNTTRNSIFLAELGFCLYPPRPANKQGDSNG